MCPKTGFWPGLTAKCLNEFNERVGGELKCLAEEHVERGVSENVRTADGKTAIQRGGMMRQGS